METGTCMDASPGVLPVWGQVGGLVEEVQVGQAHQVLVVQEPSFCIFYQYTPLLTFHLLPPLKTALSPPLKQYPLDVVPCEGKSTHL